MDSRVGQRASAKERWGRGGLLRQPQVAAGIRDQVHDAQNSKQAFWKLIRTCFGQRQSGWHHV